MKIINILLTFITLMLCISGASATTEDNPFSLGIYSNTYENGMQINITSNMLIYSVDKHSDDDNTDCFIYENDKTGTLIAQGSFVGDNCEFNESVNAYKTDIFLITLYASGSSRDKQYVGGLTGEYPKIGAYMNWIGAYQSNTGLSESFATGPMSINFNLTDPIFITAQDYYNTTTPTIYFNTTTNASMYGYVYSGNVTSYSSKNDGTIYGKTFNDGVDYGGVVHNGESAVFDGVDDYISGSSVPLLEYGGSISFYAKTLDTESTFFGLGNTNRPKIYILNGKLLVWLNNANYKYSSSVINDNQWHHYYISIRNDLDSTTIYIDDVLDEVSRINTELPAIIDKFYIGRQIDNYNNFQGSIRDVRIYNKSLSQTEITQLYTEENETTEGLIAYYPLGDNSNDMNHIASHRDSSQVMNFDGVDDYATTGNIATELNNITVSVWVNSRGLFGDSYQKLFLIDGANLLTLEATDRISFRLPSDGFLGTPEGAGVIGANEWKLITVTYDGVNRKIYVDNTLLKNGTGVASNFDLNNFRIAEAGASNFNGSLDDIRIYNRSLSQEEITKLYQGTYTNTSGLVAHYDFEELTNDKIHDRNFAICTNCVSGNYTYDIGTEGLYTNWFYNELNNNTESNTFVIDVTNPITSSGITGTIGDNDYYTTFPQVTLTANDLIDEVAYTSYRINSGSWINYTSIISVTAQGNVLLEFYSVDNAGNQETTKTENFKVDTVAPIVTHQITGTIENTWYKTQPSIELIPTDATSGIKIIYYRINSGAYTPYTESFTITTEGINEVKYYAYDNAGNYKSLTTFEIKVDTISPITTPTITGTIGENDWYVTNADVSLSGVDDTSGIDYVNYSLNSAGYVTYSSSFEVSNQGSNTILYYGVDNASNVESVKTLSFKIDTVKPNSSINFEGVDGSNDWYISFVNTTMSSDDVTSGIDYTEYRINGASWITYTTQFNIITQGNSTIEFRAIDDAGNVEVTQNQTIKIDTIDPLINIFNNSEINTYSIDWTNVFNYSDINFDSCYIIVENSTQNCSSYVFTYNGNQTIQIYVNDIAENIQNQNITIFVNPYMYFRVYDNARAFYIENYTFGSYNSIEQYITIPVYDFGLGNHSLQFSKVGYSQDNFQFIFNLTSDLNQTFNATSVTITISVYDENSPSTQLNFNLSMNNILNYTQYLNQLNFQKYYNETLTGNLTLTAESSGFSLRKVFTELNPYSTVSHTIYLLADVDSTPVVFRTLNLAQTQAIEDVVFTFKKEISGVPTFLGQAKTDSQGYTYFNMDILTDYEIIISKNGYVSQVINSIPGKTDYTILMEEEGSISSFLFDDFSYIINPQSTSKSLPFNASAVVFDEANLISSMKFTVIGENNSETQTLTEASGGTIEFEITSSSPQYLLNLTVMREGEEYTFIKKINYYTETSSNTTVKKVADELEGEENNENRVFMILIIYITAVVLGSLFSPSIGAIFGLLPITIFAFVSWITVGIAALFYVFTILGVLYFER